jgi:protocatechuate 3,4-dioxygenase beta subunit
MTNDSRRRFLRQGLFGLAAAGTAGLTLRAGAQPTAGSGGLGDYATFLRNEARSTRSAMPTAAAKGQDIDIKKIVTPASFDATADNALGPFFREGAPFRAKITPPMVAGKPLLVNGRVWGIETHKPLTDVVLDIWQANHHGRYDNDDRNNQPAPGVFRNRARVMTDDQGYYEYETIHPGQYKAGRDFRPSHIHYYVRAAGYQPLITQLYFKGDSRNEKDGLIRPSLIMDVSTLEGETGEYEFVTFDIVLAKG